MLIDCLTLTVSAQQEQAAETLRAVRCVTEELALAISAEVARRIGPYVDGYYLITPFGRTELSGRIMESIRESE